MIGTIQQLIGSGVKRILIAKKITFVFCNACGRMERTIIQAQDLVVQKGLYAKEQGPGKIATKLITNSSVTKNNKLSIAKVPSKLHMPVGRS